MPDCKLLFERTDPVVSTQPREDTVSETKREVLLVGLRMQNLALDRLRAALAREDGVPLEKAFGSPN